MKAELEKIHKNNASLQFIALQYEREIQRRKKAAKEQKHSSPLKRAHEYSLGVGGSPSPKKCKVVFDADGNRMSPEKSSPLKISNMHSDTNT